MRIHRDRINSSAIRNEMARDHYEYAELLGTFNHPKYPDSEDHRVTLYCAADALVFDTNADPVWDGQFAFDALVEEYGINLEEVA